MSRFVGALTLAAIGAYVAVFVFVGAVTSGYRPTQQLISELGQVGAPYAGLVRSMLIAVGGGVVTFSVALHRSIGGGRGPLLGPALVSGMGVALLLGGVFQCDPTCAPVTFAGWTHVLTGGAASLGALAAPFILAKRMSSDPSWSRHARPCRAFGWVALGAFGFALVSGPACGIPGVGQRLATLAQLAWVAYLAMALVRRPSPARGAA